MVEEILENLYRIEIPLPESVLKSINSYVIKAAEQNLVIDTGMDRKECMDVMQIGLKELGLDLRGTDFFITHFHVDHLGLVSRLATDSSKIYFNKPDADRLESGPYWDELVHFAYLNGFPKEELEDALHSHPGYKYRSKKHLKFDILKEGDRLSIGGYEFKCVETPGHTRGHSCLYEPHKKVFVAGDHILKDITPNIQLWSPEWNPLEQYLESLDKIDELDIELMLPGHRGIFRNYKERIQELRHHHQIRVEEIFSILGNGSKTVFQVASEMTWDIMYDSWDLFPISQKWFATGEAIAHLKYLEEKGLVRKEVQGGKISFSLE